MNPTMAQKCSYWKEDGWHMNNTCWDLWRSGKVVAVAYRTLAHWIGEYYGDDLPHRKFSGTYENPAAVMNMVEDYVTAPQCQLGAE